MALEQSERQALRKEMEANLEQLHVELRQESCSALTCCLVAHGIVARAAAEPLSLRAPQEEAERARAAAEGERVQLCRYRGHRDESFSCGGEHLDSGRYPIMLRWMSRRAPLGNRLVTSGHSCTRHSGSEGVAGDIR